MAKIYVLPFVKGDSFEELEADLIDAGYSNKRKLRHKKLGLIIWEVT